MKRFFKYYDKAEEIILVISLAVTVIIITLQIVFRYFLNASLSWSEELTRYIFIWQIWLGTSYGMRDDKHLKVTVLSDHSGERGKKILGMIADLILLAFGIFLIFNGSKIVAQLFDRQTLSTVLRVPMYLIYASLPFSNLMVVVRLAGRAIDSIRQAAGKAPAVKEEV